MHISIYVLTILYVCACIKNSIFIAKSCKFLAFILRLFSSDVLLLGGIFMPNVQLSGAVLPLKLVKRFTFLKSKI